MDLPDVIETMQSLARLLHTKDLYRCTSCKRLATREGYVWFAGRFEARCDNKGCEPAPDPDPGPASRSGWRDLDQAVDVRHINLLLAYDTGSGCYRTGSAR